MVPAPIRAVVPAPIRAMVPASVRAVVPASVISVIEEIHDRRHVRFPSVLYDVRHYLSLSDTVCRMGLVWQRRVALPSANRVIAWGNSTGRHRRNVPPLRHLGDRPATRRAWRISPIRCHWKRPRAGKACSFHAPSQPQHASEHIGVAESGTLCAASVVCSARMFPTPSSTRPTGSE